MFVFNIGQLLVIPYPAVSVTMYLFGLNFQIELYNWIYFVNKLIN